MDCIFCNIVSGEIPAWRVYENESVLAFLDIHPTTKGHLLVISKTHVPDILQASSSDVAAVMDAIQKIAPILVSRTHSEGFNLMMNTGSAAGQMVFHWHTHLIPRTSNDGLTPWPGHEYAVDEAELLAEDIKNRISNG